MELNQKQTTYGNLSKETDKKKCNMHNLRYQHFRILFFSLLKMHLHIPHVSYVFSSNTNKMTALPIMWNMKNSPTTWKKAKRASFGGALGWTVWPKVYKIVMQDAELLSTTLCTARVWGHLLNLTGHQSRGKSKFIYTQQVVILDSLRQDHQLQKWARKINLQQVHK